MAVDYSPASSREVAPAAAVAEAEETYSGTGLAVLHSRDDRKMKVVAVH
jgi:hypothetical protein